jgi:iron complex outermembrane receptor protein
VSDFESHGIYDFVLLGTERRHNDSTSEVLYQELQLNASFDRLELVTGISYFDEDVFGSPGTGSPNYDRRGTSAFPAAANGNTVDLAGFGPNGLFVTVLTDGLQQGESIGVFGNLTWHVTERLNITPGVRWAYDDKSVSQTRFRANDFAPFGGAASTTVLAEEDWNNTDWRLTGDYHLTENHMLYLTASESFRAGAYSYTIDPASSGDAQTQAIVSGVAAAFTPPEKVRNDEIGFRTEWIDGRLRVNLTYFETAYTDRQGPIQVPDATSPTGFRIQLVNTGDVDLQGFELEGQIAVAENFTIDFSAGLVDYTVKDPCANGGDFVFPGPIEDSYSLGGQWIKPLDSGADITVAVNFAHDGPQQTHAGGTAGPCFSPITGLADPVPTWFLDSRYEQPDYSLVNARVRYTSSGGTWALTVFGNNLTDEVYANFASRFGGGFWDAANPNAPGSGGIAVPLRSALSVTRGRPREYGVTFQYNFGAGGSAAR